MPVDADLAEHVARWVELFNARDLAGLAELYEADSVVVTRPGYLVTGEDQSAALAHLVGMGVPMKSVLRQAYTANDIALLVIDWSMEGTGPDGREVGLSGTATDVVRRSADGRWRYVIDNPSGVVT
ncbi:YybH family protein [Nocardia sp. CA-128927]|uniref:YybH family protein n=1 Tax=Nocardia sp. CA-128927 TaxID=3239975 RepID=UPI003D967998